MSAGTGYRYLLKSVVVGDGARNLSTPLTRYYAEQGTPPGFWLGSGVDGLGDGQIRPGEVVTEEQLQSLLGQGRDPVTGTPLGRAFPQYQSRAERIESRIATLDPKLTDDERSVAVALIDAEESARKVRRAVAGFDFTFSAPKSVSVLWALADPDTRAAVVDAHHAAVADVVGLMERQVAATRTGVTSDNGAIAQVEVQGLIATAYDHYDSRAGDPQLHTHVVISNKVKTVMDSKWRSLDSRPLHAATVALSEHYNAVLADHLTQALGVGWERRDRGRDRNPALELAGIPPELIEAFSCRSQAITVEKDRLIACYVEEHRHQPSPRTIVKLRAQATLSTRPDKTVQSLETLTSLWRATAHNVIGSEPARLLHGVGAAAVPPPSVVHAEDLPAETVEQIGRQVVAVVGEKRSTWRRWNLHAEATRQTMHLRFATTKDREAALDRIVAAAEGASLRLSPPELVSTPPEFRRADGSSVFRPRHSAVFTSTFLLEAEVRLLEVSRATAASPVVPLRNIQFAAHSRAEKGGPALSDDQTAALVAVGTSGRVVDVLVGPAGAGKTTAMRALRRAWELSHGPDSVVGLAPSAAAADVLASDLGIATENTAKWLHDHHTAVGFSPGQLVIIDEASLAGTHTLDRICRHAVNAGAKLLLVGDWAQLGAVDAGGAFGMLVRDRTDPPELTDIHRFHNDWERHASLQLRNGDVDAIEIYQAHDRMVEGETGAMLDAVFRAWKDDIGSGRSSLMTASTREIVAALNAKARGDRVDSDQVDPTTAVRLHDQTFASRGDQVMTRRNDRRLAAGKDWVKNGDRWTVTAINQDGSLSVRRHGHPPNKAVRLPHEYVAQHVELAYATTVHQAQGSTVDTTHSVIQPGTTREALYVAMTRGRSANTAYIITDQPGTEPHHDDQSAMTGRQVLQAVLGNVGAERSAHEALRSEHNRWSTIGQLAAEYETIAAAAQHDRWAGLIRTCGLTEHQAEAVIASDAFGPLAAELRRADAKHHEPESLLAHLVASRPLTDVEDIAAILQHRLSTATHPRTGSNRPRRAPRLIAGLIPEATGAMSPEMHHALADRQHMLEHRAQALAGTAIKEQVEWVRSLGPQPKDPHRRRAWNRHVVTIAAYRDRHQINATSPLGGQGTLDREHDVKQAHDALRTAQQISATDRDSATQPLENRTRRAEQPTRPQL